MRAGSSTYRLQVPFAELFTRTHAREIDGADRLKDLLDFSPRRLVGARVDHVVIHQLLSDGVSISKERINNHKQTRSTKCRRAKIQIGASQLREASGQRRNTI